MKTKVFISQSMRGRAEEEIQQERQWIEQHVLAKHPDVEFVDSILSAQDMASGLTGDRHALWCLGEALKRLATADKLVLGLNAMKSRGCKIEYECAMSYGIPVWFLP